MLDRDFADCVRCSSICASSLPIPSLERKRLANTEYWSVNVTPAVLYFASNLRLSREFCSNGTNPSTSTSLGKMP